MVQKKHYRSLLLSPRKTYNFSTLSTYRFTGICCLNGTVESAASNQHPDPVATFPSLFMMLPFSPQPRIRPWPIFCPVSIRNVSYLQISPSPHKRIVESNLFLSILHCHLWRFSFITLSVSRAVYPLFTLSLMTHCDPACHHHTIKRWR